MEIGEVQGCTFHTITDHEHIPSHPMSLTGGGDGAKDVDALVVVPQRKGKAKVFENPFEDYQSYVAVLGFCAFNTPPCGGWHGAGPWNFNLCWVWTDWHFLNLQIFSSPLYALPESEALLSNLLRKNRFVRDQFVLQTISRVGYSDRNLFLFEVRHRLPSSNDDLESVIMLAYHKVMEPHKILNPFVLCYAVGFGVS